MAQRSISKIAFAFLLLVSVFSTASVCARAQSLSAGTVTGVDSDGTVTVQWDSAQFTEDQRTADEVEAVTGSGDPAPRYAVMTDADSAVDEP